MPDLSAFGGRMQAAQAQRPSDSLLLMAAAQVHEMRKMPMIEYKAVGEGATPSEAYHSTLKEGHDKDWAKQNAQDMYIEGFKNKHGREPKNDEEFNEYVNQQAPGN